MFCFLPCLPWKYCRRLVQRGPPSYVSFEIASLLIKQTGREWPSNVLMHSDARYSSGQPEADPRMSRDGVSEDSEASAGRMKRGPTRTHGERR